MDYGFVKLIRFDSSGNVGIGTNKPQAKLNIHGNVDISGNLLPTQNITHDIGSSTKRWRDIYLSGNTIDLGGTLIQKEESGGIKIADSSGNTLDGTFQNITINGIINQSTQLDVSGSIVPTRDITYDLGSVTKRWRDIYLSGNTIDISGTRISRHTNGNMMVHDVQGKILGVTMDHIDLSGTVIRKHVDGSVAFTDVSSNRVIGRFGDIDVSGNVSATGNVTSNNIQCQNLTVNGTTTTINSTTVTVQDPIITLGSDITNTKDKGIEFKYGDSKIGFFGYNDSTGNLTFLKDASNNSEVFTGTQGTIEGLAFKSSILSGTAPLTVTSSTLVTNLNADLLEGLNPSQFMRTDISTSSTGSITSSSTITGTQLISTVPFGTAPLSVTSSTLVTNLNSMLFYGLGSTQFMRSDINTSTTGTITSSSTITGTRLISNIASGTAPLTVTSTTVVSNLNADLLDGLNSDKFMRTDANTSTTGNISAVNITSTGTLSSSSTITGTQLISNIASGTAPLSVTSTTVVTNLNADLLDGLDNTYYLNYNNLTNKPTAVIQLFSRDTRGTNDEPQARDAGLYADFKNNSTNGLTDGGSFNGVLTFRKYGSGGDFSGGPSTQLAVTENNNLWMRSSTNTTTWGSWKQANTQWTTNGSILSYTGDISLNGYLKQSKIPAFYSYQTGGTSTPNGYIGKISFTNTRLNNGNHYNVSTARFTASISGIYKFNFAAIHRYGGGEGHGELTLYKNGANMSERSFGYSYVGGTASDHDWQYVSTIATLTIGDYIEPYVRSQGANTNFYYGEELGYFMGYLLG